MDCNEARELLPLSIDRELDARSELALAAHLAACPACESERRQLSAVAKALRDRASRHAAPASLRQRIEAALPAAADVRGEAKPVRADRAPGWRFAWRLLNGAGLAAAAGAIVVLALIWPQSPSSDQRLAEELVASHARALLTDHLIDIASSDQHTVKPWFSARLDFSPPVRDFAAQGFPLAGGRLDYVDRHPAAVTIYRYRQHEIEVFTWPAAAAAAAIKPQTVQGYHVIGWTAAGLDFRAISDVEPSQLQRLAELLRE